MTKTDEDSNVQESSQDDSSILMTPERRQNIYALSSAAFFNDTGLDMLTPSYSTFMTSVISAPQWIIGLLDSISKLLLPFLVQYPNTAPIMFAEKKIKLS